MNPAEPSPEPSREPLPAAREYIVQPGDTLLAIAKRFKVELFELMNHNLITDARLLRAGQRLQIPAPTSTPTLLSPSSPVTMSTPLPSEPAPASPPPAKNAIYFVRAGDTLNSIAQRFNVTVPALLAANNLSDADPLRAGQQLFIPKPSLVLSVAEAMAEQYRPSSGVGVLGVGDPSTPVVSPQEIQAYLAGKRTTFYVTRPGDTIERVAALFRIDPLILSQINQVTVTEELPTETRLIIPMR